MTLFNKLRHRFTVNFALKHLTPHLYKKIETLGLIGYGTGHKHLKFVAKTPRPSILAIKEILGTGLIGAEIGVGEGVNAKSILEIIKPEGLFLIDAWEDYNGIDRKKGVVNRDLHYETVLEIARNNPTRVFVKKAYSLDAYKGFKNNMLDFVYLDGNHKYPYVYKDLLYWTTKVKIGGIIAGHDIFNREVMKAWYDYCSNSLYFPYVKSPDVYFIKTHECYLESVRVDIDKH